MSVAISTEKEWFNRLTFPTKSNAFSQFRSGSNNTISGNTGTGTGSGTLFNPGSHTPPRKVARLDGDEDCSTTVNRTVEDEEDLYRSTPTRGKGKGKEKEAQKDGSGIPVAQNVVVDRPPEQIPESYYNALLPKVLQSVYIVLDRPRDDRPKKAMTMSYEDVYQNTMALVVFAGKGQWLFDKLKFEFVEVMNGIVRHLTGETSSKTSNLEWLAKIVEEATWLDGCIEKLEGLLAYLDRVYLVQRRDLQRIRALAMNLFKTRIFEHAEITKRMKVAIGEWAESERNTREPHAARSTIIGLLKTLHTYALFTPLFLTPYVNLTQNYYSAESARLAASSGGSAFSPTSFLVHCDTRLREEQLRSQEVLADFSWAWSVVEECAEKSLLSERLTLLRDGLKPALDKRDKDGLKMMYNLFKRVNGLKILCDTFKTEVQKYVQVVVTDQARDEEMVERLLEFKGFLDNAIPYAFSDPVAAVTSNSEPSQSSNIASTSKSTSNNNTTNISSSTEGIVNRDFINASTDAFQRGFKARRNKPAEMIAKHLDKTMRRGQKAASDEEFGKMLDAALVLYRFTEDRDVFRAFYHRALSKRLLLQRSASDDFEKMVLKKLKEQYDPEFSMGDHMFRDLALSRDILREFHERGIGGARGEKLSVMVLQRSYWPFTARQKGDILLPLEMQTDLDKYTAFYKEAHKGHKLDFDHSLGTVTMRARFNAGDKELSISLYQAVVLLLFNDSAEIGFKEIKETTRMEDADLRRTLQSLACASKKVLRKRPPGRDVNDTDTFRFNGEFTDPQYKVHISSIQSKETPEEAKRTQASIEDDRKYYLDAAIVRVMKARKTVSHQQLVTAVIDAVKGHFVPEVKMIKTRIEQLIEQEYMKRDEEGESSNVYVYVA